jgi:hypothetical protein
MIFFWYETIYFLKVKKKKVIGTWSRDNKGRLLFFTLNR